MQVGYHILFLSDVLLKEIIVAEPMETLSVHRRILGLLGEFLMISAAMGELAFINLLFQSRNQCVALS